MNQLSNIADQLPEQKFHNGITFNVDLTQGPYFLDGCDTIPKLFKARTEELGDRTAMREKDLGIWHSYSWRFYYEQGRILGLGLLSLGLKRGEVISVLSEDRKEWLFADLGGQSVGAIVSGIYTTDSASQLEYLVNDSGSRFLFVENDEQLDKYLSVKDKVPRLTKVIVFDEDGLRDFSDERVIFIDELYELGRAHLQDHPNLFEEEIAKSKPEDTAILVYTSGTTGMPKGAMVGQGNLIFCLISSFELVPTFPTDDQICFLPLCHILERVFSSFAPLGSRSTLNFAESPETIFDNLQEVSPHTFVAVPRVWEKIYSRVSILISDATGFQRWAFKKALAVGEKKAALEFEGEAVPASLEWSYKFWDFAVLKNLRRMLGMDRMRRAGSGAAPIAPELLRWFHAIGVKIFEGYGMTESSGVISICTFGQNKVGTVGLRRSRLRSHCW